MLLKKTAWFWKSGLAAISFMLIVSVSGCSDTPQEETAVVETISEVQLPGQKDEEETEKMIECCLELYEKAAEENKIADLEMIRSIVNRFGENGYPAVDSRNIYYPFSVSATFYPYFFINCMIVFENHNIHSKIPKRNDTSLIMYRILCVCI